MPLPPVSHIGPELTTPEVPHGQESSLHVIVVFTSIKETIAALKQAGSMAESLGARITLIVPHVVPYPLLLTTPSVELEFEEERIRRIAAESPVDVAVRLLLCRDRIETVRNALSPRSVVVLGERKRLWPTTSSRMTRQLRAAGHEVIVTNPL